MLTYTARSRARPETVWGLMARPARWARWAPHVRGARGLGDPDVQQGARGQVRLAGLLPISATITEVEPGRSWTWRVGGVQMRHTVSAGENGEGSVIVMEISAPVALEAAVALTYGSAAALLLRNLARVAERV